MLHITAMCFPGCLHLNANLNLAFRQHRKTRLLDACHVFIEETISALLQSPHGCRPVLFRYSQQLFSHTVETLQQLKACPPGAMPVAKYLRATTPDRV